MRKIISSLIWWVFYTLDAYGNVTMSPRFAARTGCEHVRLWAEQAGALVYASCLPYVSSSWNE